MNYRVRRLKAELETPGLYKKVRLNCLAIGSRVIRLDLDLRRLEDRKYNGFKNNKSRARGMKRVVVYRVYVSVLFSVAS